jgi:hypothetical protein
MKKLLFYPGVIKLKKLRVTLTELFTEAPFTNKATVDCVAVT